MNQGAQAYAPPEVEAKHSLDDFHRMYSEGDSVDQETFAEMRSNLLLYAGDHYSKRTSNYYKRVRDSKELSQEQKLRLTKNHIQYICDTYANSIVSTDPGVGFTPKDEKSPHDQKVADMHHAVWQDAHERYNLDDKIDDWVDSFVQIGECAVKIYFDPTKGKVKAYNQKTDEQGNPVFVGYQGETTQPMDPMFGQQFHPAPNFEDPIFHGEFCFEEIYGFNLLRPSETKDLRESPWLGIRKMAYTAELKNRFKDAAATIQSTSDQTFQVFDATKGGYTKTNNQTLVTEYYFRPCWEYPNGYFYITTKDVILAQGELPGGIFPIVVQPMKKFATTPRGRSPIKTMRPYQAEINRGSSKLAEHQITLGDDKLILTNGSKPTSGISIPGIRTVNVTGQAPTVLQGRDGSQYLNTISANITELYTVMAVREVIEDMPAQLDPYVMLFRAASQKKKFQRYIRRFEKFLCEVVKVYLGLAKVHLTDDYLVMAVGSNDQVNIPEFRKLPDTCYEIKIEAVSDDVESKIGKQITINHALQYIGAKLQPEDIGRIMRQMPYANFDEAFGPMTQDYDNSLNDILALDRGEQPPINQYDNHVFCIKSLVSRMRKPDFKYLPPQVQQSYSMKVQLHQQFQSQNMLAIQRAEQGLIPTSGYLAKCDLYVPNADDPNKKERVTLPADAIAWLIKQLEAQQSGMAPLESLPSGAQAQMANNFAGASGMPPSNRAVNPMAMGSSG